MGRDHGRPETDTSLLQLLDVVERRLDNAAVTLSRTDATIPELDPKEIDDTILKISAVLRKARSIKNSFAPVNRIPPETFALTTTFLPKQRDVINATAVCRQWRATLLSFPQVWRKAGGSSSELEAYLQRSKSVPIEVNLSSPSLAASIVPHTSRLEKLTVCIDDLAGFGHITDQLRDPIPTLDTLTILASNERLSTLMLPTGINEALFRHVKTLALYGISAIVNSPTFPHITELFLCTSRSPWGPTIGLLYTLGHLPGLVKACLMFQGGWYTDVHAPGVVKLPCLEEISLVALDFTEPRAGAISPVLRFLELPKARVISMRSPFPSYANIAVFPTTSFSEHLPNYVELQELRIETNKGSGEIVFRSASQACLTYYTEQLADHERELLLWGDLPIRSIRRVTAIQLDLRNGGEDVWLVGLLGKLESLEVLELGGDCGHVLRRLRHRMVSGVISIKINTLIVRGGGYAESQVLKFESVKDAVGLGDTTVTYTPDPAVSEGFSDFGSESEGDPDLDDGNYSDDEDGEDDDDEEDGDDDSDEDDEDE